VLIVSVFVLKRFLGRKKGQQPPAAETPAAD
jgi:hypothetical protein